MDDRRSRHARLAIAQRAFILGGTGNVGSAIAHSLLRDGWQLTLAGKSEGGARAKEYEYLALDRDQDGALSVANGFDLVIDVIPFEAAHAKQLLGLDTGALIAISSASVYADDEARTLDEAEGVDDFPELPVPIPETQATVEPGDGTYSTKKVALERILLENGEVPAAIVRPCAIYGRGDRMGREWHFVKRALDDRPHVILTSGGVGRFHTTASENIGELVRLVAAQPARGGAYNCGDPDPPSVLEIARAIAASRRSQLRRGAPARTGRQRGARSDAVVDAEAVPRRYGQGRDRARLPTSGELGGRAASAGRVADRGDARA